MVDKFYFIFFWYGQMEYAWSTCQLVTLWSINFAALDDTCQRSEYATQVCKKFGDVFNNTINIVLFCSNGETDLSNRHEELVSNQIKRIPKTHKSKKKLKFFFFGNKCIGKGVALIFFTCNPV